jgi:hypothetical protein
MRRLRGKVDYMAVAEDVTGVDSYGIPKSFDAARKAVESGELKTVDDPDKVNSGPIVETFSITVAKGEEVFYTTGKDSDGKSKKSQPFGWTKVDSLAGVFENLLENDSKNTEKVTLTDDQVGFLSEALAGSDILGRANKSLVEIYNSWNRANAKGAMYQAIVNAVTPISEEDKESAAKRAIVLFAKSQGVTLEEAERRYNLMMGLASK